MPSQSTRQLKKLPRGIDSAGSSGEQQAYADDDPSSHDDDHDASRPASGPIDQDHASSLSAQHEEEEEEPIIRTSHTFEADISAFETPNAFESSRSPRRESTSPSQQRSGRRSYYPDADYPARTSYPKQGGDDIQTTSPQHQLVAHTPSRATIAPPVVTRDVTRREETFGSSSSISPVKKSSFNRKQKYVHPHHPATTGVDKNLSASSSSEIDEDTTRGRVMELFSPPSPSSLRTSRRQQMHHDDHETDSLAAAVTTSTSLDPSVGTICCPDFYVYWMTHLVH